jgi:peroxiredoxin Q/BCP
MRRLDPFLRLSAAAVGVLVMLTAWPAVSRAQSRTPAVGDTARDFTLADVNNVQVALSAELARGPVVLIALRGWPGYHCPFCVRQFGEFLGRARDLEAAGARVLWVYPAASRTDIHADGFIANKDVPPFFRLLLDPGYSFTNLYGLRWDAPQETSYPATFVIDRQGVVRFAHVSRSHGGRTAVDDVLSALKGVNAR